MADGAGEPTLYLVDGSGYIFRAYFAVRQNLSTAAGLPPNALTGFTRMLRALLDKGTDAGQYACICVRCDRHFP